MLFGIFQCSYSRILFRIASSRRYAQIDRSAHTHILAHICATKQSRTNSFSTNIGTIPKNIPTNFKLKRLKLELNIVKKTWNRVHKLEVDKYKYKLTVSIYNTTGAPICSHSDSVAVCIVTFFEIIIPMFLPKDFVRHCFASRACHARADDPNTGKRISGWRSKSSLTTSRSRRSSVHVRIY